MIKIMSRKGFKDKFFDAWSQEVAYVLGFMFADGYVYMNPRGGWYFCFCSTDRDIIRGIRTALCSEHKIGIKLGKIGSARPRDLYVLQIGSKMICTKLAGLGIFQNKSLAIKFPEVPAEFLGGFVRGYFDGDGCVSFKRYWRKDRGRWKYQLTARFTSGSRRFLKGLWVALADHIKGGDLKEKERGWELVFGQHDAVAIFALIYDNVPAELFLERKRKIFEEAFQKLNMQP
jgi:hypothetical protein